MANHFAQQPLPASFMIISMLGGLFSTLVVWPISQTWGFALTLLFVIWFIASVINFTHAESEEALDIHNSRRHIKNS